ncbi:MAG: phosphoribosyl-AMP cyclohydrolase [Hyphomicrobiales bacterium]|nr:MAG: phosphoribosyl-AMP cyclohydrolase [Hyphomicrobiales bacterium]
MPSPSPGPCASQTGRSKLEEGIAFTPRFDADGLIACVTKDASDGQILMLAYMNAEALQLTLVTGVAHYWSRSRQTLWRKGDTSGQIQKITEIRTDCDQDALLLTVEPGGNGGACHTGRRSCFYRKVALSGDKAKLVFD